MPPQTWQPFPLPPWASDLIARQSDLATDWYHRDEALAEHARRLRAWPVYGDMGGVLLVAADGQVHCRDNNWMGIAPEANPRWRLLAWVAAAAAAPELRALLPARPHDAPDCAGCGGAGCVRIGAVEGVWCGGCMGLGWRLHGLPDWELPALDTSVGRPR